MNKEKYIQDLQEIKDIMNRSSRFISLSGLSGISAGVVALLGAYAMFQIVFVDHSYLTYQPGKLTSTDLNNLMMIAVLTLTVAMSLAIYFTTRETKKRKLNIWDLQTKRLLINLAIPLVTGGLVCLLLLIRGFLGLVVPFTLIFYGLALVNASKYTLNEIRSLGLAEILLGLLAMVFIPQSLIFWAVGFGVLHIIYGTAMQLKYRS